MRRRLLTVPIISGGKYLKINGTTWGDVMFYNPKDKSLFFERDFEKVSETCTPLGVVVIPASMNYYDDGMPAVMCLKEFNSTLGNPADYIKSLTYAAVWKNDGDGDPNTPIACAKSYCHIASDSIGASSWATENTLDPETRYGNTSYLAISQYKNGAINPDFFTGSIKTNPFQDKTGWNHVKANTGCLEGEWKDTGVLPGSGSPCAQSAWLFNFDGKTANGCWYIPSVAEMAFAFARKKIIANTITELNKKWPGNPLMQSSYYGTCTRGNYTNYSAIMVRWSDGYCNVNGTASTERPYRPFFHIEPISIQDESTLEPSTIYPANEIYQKTEPAPTGLYFASGKPWVETGSGMVGQVHHSYLSRMWLDASASDLMRKVVIEVDSGPYVQYVKPNGTVWFNLHNGANWYDNALEKGEVADRSFGLTYKKDNETITRDEFVSSVFNVLNSESLSCATVADSLMPVEFTACYTYEVYADSGNLLMMMTAANGSNSGILFGPGDWSNYWLNAEQLDAYLGFNNLNPTVYFQNVPPVPEILYPLAATTKGTLYINLREPEHDVSKEFLKRVSSSSRIVIKDTLFYK